MAAGASELMAKAADCASRNDASSAVAIFAADCTLPAGAALLRAFGSWLRSADDAVGGEAGKWMPEALLGRSPAADFSFEAGSAGRLRLLRSNACVRSSTSCAEAPAAGGAAVLCFGHTMGRWRFGVGDAASNSPSSASDMPLVPLLLWLSSSSSSAQRFFRLVPAAQHQSRLWCACRMLLNTVRKIHEQVTQMHRMTG